MTLIVTKTGAGRRSHGRILRYLEVLVDEFTSGSDETEIFDKFADGTEFLFLIASSSHIAADEENPSRRFSRATKSASFIDSAVKGAVRCGVCGALVHVNSMQVDHIQDASKGGATDAGNAQITHPYCNSAKPILKGAA